MIDRKPLDGDGLLLLVSRQTGTISQRAARKGQGPGEILDSISIDTLPNDPDKISLYDYRNRRITIFSLNPWNDKPIELLVHDDPGATFESYWLSRNRVVMNGNFRDHLLRFYEVIDKDTLLRLAEKIGESIFPDEPPHAQSDLNKNLMAVRPDRRRIVLAFVRAARLHVYDETGRLISELAAPQPHDVEVSYTADGSLDKSRPYAFQAVAASQDHIYGLFSGSGGEASYYGDMVQVFTWEGKLVELLHLERPVFFLEADPQDDYLLGLTDEPFPQIVEFELR